MAWKLEDDRPIWLQLSQQLARRIITGTYPPGSRLPSVRELAAEAGVNPNTMQRALAQLEQEGLARLREAEAVLQTCFASMAALGYSRAQTMELLKEEFQ